MQSPDWHSVLRPHKNGILVLIIVQPKAARSEVVGLYGEPARVKIRIQAPPVDGAANVELLRFLTRKLNVAKSQLQILRGETSRWKDVLCEGLSAIEVTERLRSRGV